MKKLIAAVALTAWTLPVSARAECHLMLTDISTICWEDSYGNRGCDTTYWYTSTCGIGVVVVGDGGGGPGGPGGGGGGTPPGSTPWTIRKRPPEELLQWLFAPRLFDPCASFGSASQPRHLAWWDLAPYNPLYDSASRARWLRDKARFSDICSAGWGPVRESQCLVLTPQTSAGPAPVCACCELNGDRGGDIPGGPPPPDVFLP